MPKSVMSYRQNIAQKGRPSRKKMIWDELDKFALGRVRKSTESDTDVLVKAAERFQALTTVNAELGDQLSVALKGNEKLSAECDALKAELAALKSNAKTDTKKAK